MKTYKRDQLKGISQALLNAVQARTDEFDVPRQFIRENPWFADLLGHSSEAVNLLALVKEVGVKLEEVPIDEHLSEVFGERVLFKISNSLGYDFTLYFRKEGEEFVFGTWTYGMPKGWKYKEAPIYKKILRHLPDENMRRMVELERIEYYLHYCFGAYFLGTPSGITKDAVEKMTPFQKIGVLEEIAHLNSLELILNEFLEDIRYFLSTTNKDEFRTVDDVV